jgi:hypothetical protein
MPNPQPINNPSSGSIGISHFLSAFLAFLAASLRASTGITVSGAFLFYAFP